MLTLNAKELSPEKENPQPGNDWGVEPAVGEATPNGLNDARNVVPSSEQPLDCENVETTEPPTRESPAEFVDRLIAACVVQKLDRLVSELAELQMQCAPSAQREHPKVIRSPAARKKFKTRRWQEKPFCEFCDKELLLDEATIDHMLPRCRGGDDADDNLVVCCEPCNSTKGSMTATEFEQAKRAGLHVQPLRRTKKALASFKKRRWTRHPYCEFCDKVLSRYEALLDRKVPLGRGGGDYGNNLILCCERCRSSKGNQTADEYQQSIWLSQLECLSFRSCEVSRPSGALCFGRPVSLGSHNHVRRNPRLRHR